MELITNTAMLVNKLVGFMESIKAQHLFLLNSLAMMARDWPCRQVIFDAARDEPGGKCFC